MAGRRDIGRLQGEIEELFADLWEVPRFSGMRAGFRPQVDVFRTQEPPQLTIVVELPGVDADAIRIELGERELVLAGERVRPRAQGRVYERMEIEYGAFERRIPLREPVDSESATASYEAGVLTVVLPLAAQRVAPTGHVVLVVGKLR